MTGKVGGYACQSLPRFARRLRLLEPARAPDLTPQRERSPELDPELRPRLRAPSLVQHRAQDTVDPKPRVPEALVGVALFVISSSARMGLVAVARHAGQEHRADCGADQGEQVPTPRRRASSSAARGCRACDHTTARDSYDRFTIRVRVKCLSISEHVVQRLAEAENRGHDEMTPGPTACIEERLEELAKRFVADSIAAHDILHRKIRLT